MGGTVSITNSQIKDVQYGMAFQKDAAPTITNNQMVAIDKAPFVLSLYANPTFTNNTFTSVGSAALALLAGDVNGSGTIRKRDVAGYQNITYTTSGSISIKENALVTVEPGVVIKVAPGNQINVYGGFKLAGTVSEPITFTSLQDDNIGNPLDTNGDGNSTVPARGNWSTISYHPTSDDTFNNIDYGSFKYGGLVGSSYTTGKGLVHLSDATFSISNTLFSESSTWGLSLEGTSAPDLSNVDFSNTNHAPLAISFHANPSFNNITFSAVKYNSIHLIDTERNYPKLNSAATLSPRSLAGFANLPYTSGYYFDIAANGSLTITNGVIIKSLNSGIRVYGSLNITGISGDPVIITSIGDDAAGGDTNGDGNQAVPAAGNWSAIIFKEGSTNNSVDFAKLKFGRDGTLSFDNSSGTISNCELSFITGNAFYIKGSASPVITDNVLSNVIGLPVYMSMFANPTFSGNTMSNMGLYAIGLIPETYSQSATLVKRDFGGYTNITYMMYGAYIVSSGAELTIPSGMVFKTSRSRYGVNREFAINGKLILSGTVADSVVFTDISDDSYGNPADTQLNGEVTISTYINKRWIAFKSGSDQTSNINYTLFKHIDSEAVLFESAGATIANSKFEETRVGVKLTGVSSPILNNNIFHNIDSYSGREGFPVVMSLASSLGSYSGNSITGETSKSIGIITETMVQDATLSKINFASINAIPYTFTGAYTVGSGVKLTIDPGVVCKFNAGLMDIKGSLYAQGTIDQTIVFTYHADGFYGGQSRSDNYTSGNYWQGLKFRDESTDADNVFKNCIFNFGNYIYYDGIITESASPLFDSCLFKNEIGNNKNIFAITGSSDVKINNSDFVLGGDGLGIDNQGTFIIDATNNWWGENSGPTHSGNTGGAGAGVSDNVTYNPWKTSLATNPQTGDVSLNGSVSAYDAALILQSVVGDITLSALQTRVADVSGESGVTAMDASYILQLKAGVIDAFPSESSNRRMIPLTAYTQMSLAGDVESLLPGDVVTLALQIDDISNLMALQAELRFDDQVFDFVAFDWSDNVSALAPLHKIHEGKINFAMASLQEHTVGGDIAKLTLKVKTEVRGEFDATVEIINSIANETTLDSAFKNIAIFGAPEQADFISIYPNPMNSGEQLSLRYQLAEAGSVELSMFDMSGRLVQSSSQQHDTEGRFEILWSTPQEPGIYFLHVKMNGQLFVQKVAINQ